MCGVSDFIANCNCDLDGVPRQRFVISNDYLLSLGPGSMGARLLTSFNILTLALIPSTSASFCDSRDERTASE